MRVPISWVAEFVELPALPVRQMVERFTLASCEVENLLSTWPLWDEALFVEIVSLEPHPNSEKLRLPTIDTGHETVRLVCGASNLHVGMKTFWAPPGTRFGEIQLQTKEIRGILSPGMLCSQRELGMGSDHEGIIDWRRTLSALGETEVSVPLGSSLTNCVAAFAGPERPLPAEWTGLESRPFDFILDIDNKSLTNRPDMWGIYGIAREFAAVLRVPFRQKYDRDWQRTCTARFGPGASPIVPAVEAGSSCLAYSALSIDGAEVKESPPRLRHRLEAAGLHSINSVVDVSNYVMLELGLPTHIFDRDELEGSRIWVKRAGSAQTLTTLDGVERHLEAGDTIVADQRGPRTIAGIMGEQDSAVTEQTHSLLLEVAVWRADATRLCSARLGLRTDSSLRYEKSLDPLMIERSLLRMSELILELSPGAKILGKAEFYYAPGHSPGEFQPVRIRTSAERISSVLGVSVSGDESIREIFSRLGFECRESGDSLDVTLPSFRTTKDLSIEEDLVEEVGRLLGYGNIPAHSPLTVLKPVSLQPFQKRRRKIQDFLVARAEAQEVFGYPLLGAKLLESCQWPETAGELKLANPLHPGQDRMRPSLIPGLIEMVSRNESQGVRHDFRLFELGRSYRSPAAGKIEPEEREQLAVAFYSHTEHPLLALRNICEKLPALLGGAGTWRPEFPSTQNLVAESWAGLHPEQRVGFFPTDPECPMQAVLFTVHPSLLGTWKLRGELALACFDFGSLSEAEAFRPAERLSFREPSRFPVAEFDCTVVLKPRVLASEAVGALQAGFGPTDPESGFLKTVYVRNVFQAPGSLDRWLTLQCVFAREKATLESAELKLLEDRAVAVLERAGFPLKE